MSVEQEPVTEPELSAADQGRTNLGLFAAAVALLLPTVYLPTLDTPHWAPKMAIVAVLAAVGLPLILSRPPPGLERATWAARAFVACAALSTALSPNPDLALVGLWNQGTGFVFVLACVGAWAIGLRLSRADVALAGGALVAAVIVNVLVVAAEMRFDLTAIGLSRVLGRASGLLQSPVFLGPFVAGGLALLVGPIRQRRPWAVVLAPACGLALGLSGGRGAALGAVLVAGWAVWRHGFRTAGALVVLVSLGLAASPVFDRVPVRPKQDVIGTPIQSESTEATVSEGRRPLTPRLATWLSVRHSVADRPLLGAGPGQFRAATIEYRPESVALDTPGRYFTDAHNFVVEHAATTGLLGLAALLAWVVGAVLPARGALGVFAAVVGFAHLFQPQNVGTTPLALLALGAASTHSFSTAGTNPVAFRTAAALGAVGVGAAGMALYSAALLVDANLDLNLRKAERADIALRAWPQPQARQGLIHQSQWVAGDQSAAERARSAYAEAARREPDDPQRWVLLAEVAVSHGEVGLARTALRRAFELDPYSPRALGLNRRRQLLKRERERDSGAAEAAPLRSSS